MAALVVCASFDHSADTGPLRPESKVVPGTIPLGLASDNLAQAITLRCHVTVHASDDFDLICQMLTLRIFRR